MSKQYKEEEEQRRASKTKDGKGHSNRENSQTRKTRKGNSRRNNSHDGENHGAAKSAGKSTNDPAFYNRNPELVNNVANVPFVTSLGVPVKDYDVERKGLPFYQPGIMVYNIIPTIGASKDSFSALNRMVTMQWTYLRSAISGARSYEPSDIGIYYAAMANVNAYIKYLERAYGVMHWVSARNRYLPESVITSMGFNYRDLRTNLNKFRYQINMLKMSAASLVIPKDLPIFDRQAMLFEHVYAESDSPLAQLYLMRPLGFYKFGYNDEDGRPQLEFQKLPFADAVCGYQFFEGYTLDSEGESLLTVDAAVRIGEELIKALVTDEWVNTISGDMLRAYGSNVVTYTMTPEEYVTPLTLDIAFLQQLCNARPLNPFVDYGIRVDDLDITQEFISAEEGSYLKCDPVFTYVDSIENKLIIPEPALIYGRMKPIVRLTVDSVSPLNLIYVTRLTNGFTPDDIIDELHISPHFGAELLVSIDMVTKPSAHGNSVQFLRYPAELNWARMENLMGVTQFTFGPVIPQITVNDDDELQLSGFIQNVDNFAFIDYTTLDDMNDVAAMSLLDVPVISLIK